MKTLPINFLESNGSHELPDIHSLTAIIGHNGVGKTAELCKILERYKSLNKDCNRIVFDTFGALDKVSDIKLTLHNCSTILNDDLKDSIIALDDYKLIEDTFISNKIYFIKYGTEKNNRVIYSMHSPKLIPSYLLSKTTNFYVFRTKGVDIEYPYVICNPLLNLAISLVNIYTKTYNIGNHADGFPHCIVDINKGTITAVNMSDFIN